MWNFEIFSISGIASSSSYAFLPDLHYLSKSPMQSLLLNQCSKLHWQIIPHFRWSRICTFNSSTRLEFWEYIPLSVYLASLKKTLHTDEIRTLRNFILSSHRCVPSDSKVLFPSLYKLHERESNHWNVKMECYAILLSGFFLWNEKQALHTYSLTCLIIEHHITSI